MGSEADGCCFTRPASRDAVTISARRRRRSRLRKSPVLDGRASNETWAGGAKLRYPLTAMMQASSKHCHLEKTKRDRVADVNRSHRLNQKRDRVADVTR